MPLQLATGPRLFKNGSVEYERITLVDGVTEIRRASKYEAVVGEVHYERSNAERIEARSASLVYEFVVYGNGIYKPPLFYAA